MGFFSFDCLCCQRSVRSYHSIRRTSGWMSSAVVVFKDRRRTPLIGTYDGYGRIDDGPERADAVITFAELLGYDRKVKALTPPFTLRELAEQYKSIKV